jgi:hypothetical protein
VIQYFFTSVSRDRCRRISGWTQSKTNIQQPYTLHITRFLLQSQGNVYTTRPALTQCYQTETLTKLHGITTHIKMQNFTFTVT